MEHFLSDVEHFLWGPAASLALGAFLAALFGLGADYVRNRSQTLARRHLMFRILHRQIGSIPFAKIPASDQSWEHLDIYRVSAVDQLLAGDALDAHADADLIRALSLWQKLEERYNDAVVLARQAAITPGVPPEVRQRCYEAVDTFHVGLREWRNTIRGLIPPDEIAYSASLGQERPLESWGASDSGWKTLRRLRELPGLLMISRRSKRDWEQAVRRQLQTQESNRQSRQEARMKQELAEAEYRNQAQDLIRSVVLPEIESASEMLQTQGYQLRYSPAPVHQYDPNNPQLSGGQIVSFSPIWIDIQDSEGISHAFAILARCSPTGIQWTVAGEAPRERGAHQGWKRQICRGIDITSAAVLAALHLCLRSIDQ